ncbi:MAG: L,D-transpeptidase family protein [Clostridia bacterium]|nr:L,D-transpeptidase family protein [Clostridia bacterium]
MNRKMIILFVFICFAFICSGCGQQKSTPAAAMSFTTPRKRLEHKVKESPEWIKNLPQASKAEQLFVVAAREKTTAWISMHQKDKDGNWKMIMSTPGFIGREGIGKTKEGDGKTPTGVFTFDRAFGIAEDPGCAIPYVRADENIYWSGDIREGMRYNELVNIKELPELDTSSSEQIAAYPFEYQYCLNISYNAEKKASLGSAIFLHCFGERNPSTGGCVAIPEEQMYYVMRNVSPNCVVIIDTMENLSKQDGTGN